MRISKEIIEFGSGKDPEFVRERVAKSPGLTAEQQATLEARGYLSPDEIHKLAQATAGVVVAAGKDKADCHSDYVDPDAAKRLQAEKLETGPQTRRERRDLGDY